MLGRWPLLRAGYGDGLIVESIIIRHRGKSRRYRIAVASCGRRPVAGGMRQP